MQTEDGKLHVALRPMQRLARLLAAVPHEPRDKFSATKSHHCKFAIFQRDLCAVVPLKPLALMRPRKRSSSCQRF